MTAINTGNAIVSNIVRTGEIKPFLDAGMTAAWLGDKESGWDGVFDGADLDVYELLLAHKVKHGTVMTEEQVRAKIRSLPKTFFDTARDYEASELIEQAVTDAQRRILDNIAEDVTAKRKNRNYPAAVEALLAGAVRLSKGLREDGGSFTLLSDEDFDLEAFMAAKPEGVNGVPMGIARIDDDFGGWQPGMLITYLGRQKAMKTSMMLYSSYYAWEKGHRVLFYSVELDEELLRQRLYGIGAGVNANRFRRGALTDAERERVSALQERIDQAADDNNVEYAISKKTAMLNMDDITREVDDFKPDVVYIDGFYFMRDRLSGKSAGSNWEANENIAAELKELAMTRKIPVVTSTQVQEKQHNNKTDGIDGATIQGGTGLLKASDLVLGLDKEQDEDELKINCVLSRFKPIDEVKVIWNWDKMVLEIQGERPPGQGRVNLGGI